ncbi:unnamed protein product, partial [Symbiodinium sp. KB8]
VCQSIRLLRACSFCGHDIEVTLAYACAYFRRVLPSLIHRVGSLEAVHIVVLLIYMAHSFVLDETCPIGEWHKYVFKKYCSLKKMDSALFHLLELLKWRLMVDDDEQEMLLQAIQRKEHCKECLIGSILGILVLAAVIVIVAVAAGSHHGGIPCVRLPCTADDACKKQLPSEDMMQQGYKAQWGASGRNDLGIIKQLGANAVRLYHSMGKGPATDHSGFLDEALKQGLNVLPGIDSDLGIYNCTEFDCYETVKKVVKTGFSLGFAKGKNWHPAVHTVIIMNEPDFFGNDPKCPGKAPWCRVKAVLSGLDGLLAAEREAGILPGRLFERKWVVG